jgi:N-acetyl-anhydromuramyl-L-alanine amidase AmpD
MDTRTVQMLLWRLGYDPHGVDGVDGTNTEAAKAAFCSAMGIESAAFESTLIEQAAGLRPFIQAKNFTPSTRPNPPHPINKIVIHTMEAPEKPKTARNVATWFGGPSAPQASAHFCVDDAEVIQSVLECDVAWHAPGANNDGIGIEHAGYASQTPDQWHDDYSKAVLANSAQLAAELAKRFDIPVVWLSVEDLKAGKRGFCGHIDCTNAFSGGHGHTDPGPNFPKDEYLELVRQAMG